MTEVKGNLLTYILYPKPLALFFITRLEAQCMKLESPNPLCQTHHRRWDLSVRLLVTGCVGITTMGFLYIWKCIDISLYCVPLLPLMITIHIKQYCQN